MMMKKNMLASAVTNMAPLRSKKLNEIESALRDVLSAYGCIEIFLPIYDYYDMLSGTTQGFSDEHIIRFIDRNTGKSLVLRPDFTPQVCRYAANYMNNYPLPIRLGYRGRVFRNVNMDKGIKSEKTQVGCELFGLEEMTGDIELLLIAERGIKALNLSGHRYVIGDMKFNSELLKLAGDLREEFLRALSAKNLDRMKQVIDSSAMDDKTKKFLKSIPFAYGGREVLKELYESSPNDEIGARVSYIEKFFDRLVEMGIDEKALVFDASECKGYDYYTGLTFEILHGGIGSKIGTGGRYDNLAGKFDFNVPACGMAFYVEEIINVDKPSEVKVSFDYMTGDQAQAEKLRTEGKTVLYVENNENRDKFLEFYEIGQIL
ncbi:ATP phosphoribosyltransferase regulatory subunit [Geovibrio thiophilus]|uniref:ATP phosphoribosyltransferase regulatory subunit n=1 Tax=Geovibrio thiophilus TaxID=139438 RepID=A0A3R5UTJ9_9BACT|nr:ATP phosphoribosyltransferase regulatory subunit [Geovibrio thiophilus]QAR32127.1 ATP phosphoribosyltransferase regulatory subunit [Geovibrio thiophilus]